MGGKTLYYIVTVYVWFVEWLAVIYPHSFLSLLFYPWFVHSTPSSLYYVCVSRVLRSYCFFQQIRADIQSVHPMRSSLFISLCLSFAPSSLSPWVPDVCLFSHHYEWCCAGCRGCSRLPFGPLPPPALWRFAGAAADGPLRNAAVLVSLLPHRLHPATRCQHGTKDCLICRRQGLLC